MKKPTRPAKRRPTRARPRPNRVNKGGRPRLSDAEKARRGTLQRCYARRKGRRPKAPARAGRVARRDYVTIARQYAADVLSGKIPACVWVKLACERQDRDVMRAITDPSWPYVWSDAHAVEACGFIEQLPHVEGKWTTPTIVLQPPQVFLLVCLYGWRHRVDRSRRRFTVLYWEAARKSAKSTLMAAIALFHVLKECEPGAAAICGATTGSQARIVFGIAQRMVRRSAWLREQGAEALANAIVTRDGTIKPINAKASTQDGLNPSLICLDEAHAQTFELHDVLKSAQGARQNPLLACPTTAGYNQLSVGYALRTTLTKVLQQVLEADHLLGAIYTLDEGDDWRDESVWRKSNPMLGITPTLDWVRTYCLDAQQTPAMEAEFRVKCCSEWCNSASTWLSMAAWDRCADPSLTLDAFAGEPCWIGADLAQLDDLAAVALVFKRDDVLYGFVRSYLPEQVVQERARAVPEYRAWVQAGLLTLTDGNMIDYSLIERDIRGWCQQFTVRAISFDQFGSVQIAGNLSNDGLPAWIEAKNAKTFTPPARELEARVKHAKFRHDGNSCLKWQASNVVVSRRIDDSILPKKDGPESPNKIDAIDALLQAIAAMLRAPAPAERTYQLFVLGGSGAR